jgi:hypothetical protein
VLPWAFVRFIPLGGSLHLHLSPSRRGLSKSERYQRLHRVRAHMDHIYGLNAGLNDTTVSAEFLCDRQAARERWIGRDGDVGDVWDVATKVAAKHPVIKPVMKRHEFRVPILGHKKDMAARTGCVANGPCLLDHDAYRTGVGDHRSDVHCNSLRICIDREHESEVRPDHACLWVVLHAGQFDPPVIRRGKDGIRDDGQLRHSESTLLPYMVRPTPR